MRPATQLPVGWARGSWDLLLTEGKPGNTQPLVRVRWHVKCILSHFSGVPLCVTLWTVAGQAPLFMGFSRLLQGSGLPGPSLGDLPNPRIEPMSLKSPVLAGGFFTTSAPWEAQSQMDLGSNSEQSTLTQIPHKTLTKQPLWQRHMGSWHRGTCDELEEPAVGCVELQGGGRGSQRLPRKEGTKRTNHSSPGFRGKRLPLRCTNKRPEHRLDTQGGPQIKLV